MQSEFVLKSLKIEGFKTIRNAEIEFGRVNIFIGGNGSGKSNLLEALGLLSASLKDISDLELQKRGVRLSVPTLFKTSFKNTSLKKNFKLSANFDNETTYQVAIQAGENFDSLRFFSENIMYHGISRMGRSPNGVRVEGISTPRKDVDPSRGMWDRFRETIDLPDDFLKELDRMAKFAIYAPQTAFLRGTDNEAIPVKPLGLQGGNLPQAARTIIRIFQSKDTAKIILLRQLFSVVFKPGWTSGFRVESRDSSQVSSKVLANDVLYFIDRYMKIGRNKLSAYDSSEGTLYLLFIAVLLSHPESPKIFALDNIDNALNPSITQTLLEKIIEATCDDSFREKNIGPHQVFLTSHNPTSLDAFDIFSDDQRVFVVSRSDTTGETKIERLQPKRGTDRADWIEFAAGKSLSELWIEGKIKGALGL